ncbi:hypothetical protein GUITHDRAFT_111696 [Guillardia theta CCMP2712]|uniref:PAS domain-containing protein n=1 Tax=Guillardia theta (strain CCMP2712) TaxID=905079 RepID=L1J1L6_GUITC|nr:hypothetical protein GUITHDRAFT_111696 [Guillardia theta CCMP2712]EKX42418.1 hypothetical protein GUITHDRAFT_111696 [Guillardia theta CCMP2712]|eukprot:XP_005829398.1 hypothetical protein GUITHDRAFT_111696 [Guillardia theta CCMP2712]
MASSCKVVDLKAAIHKLEDGLTVLLSNETKKISHISHNLCSILNLDADGMSEDERNAILGSEADLLFLKDLCESVGRGLTEAKGVRSTLYGRDGMPIFMRLKAFPVLDSKLQMTHVQLDFEKVHEVKLSTVVGQIKADSKAKFVAMAREPFQILYANSSWCSIYGVSHREVIGCDLQLIQGPTGDKQALKNLLDIALSGSDENCTISFLHRDGSSLSTSLEIVPVRSDDGKMMLFMGTVLNVSVDQKNAEYPITPTGHITHINGYTQLVLYPKADPTLEHCIDYLGHLRDAAIVKSWKWDGDALRVNVDTGRVLKYTQNSAWCRIWTADLRTWHAWWNRMLWVVSEASRKQKEEHFQVAAEQVGGGKPQNGQSGEKEGNKAREATGRSESKQLKSKHESYRHWQESAAFPVLSQLDKELELCGIEGSLCLLHKNGNILFANQSFLRLLNQRKAQIVGKSFFDLVSPNVDAAEFKRFQSLLHKGKATQRAVSCLEFKTGKKSTFWASIVAGFYPLECRETVLECFCVSAEDSSEIVSATRNILEPITEENDSYTYFMAQELSILQDEAIEGLGKILDRFKNREVGKRAKRVRFDDVQIQRISLLVPAGIDRVSCIESLWSLKEGGWILSWMWDTDSIDFYIDVAAVSKHPSLVKAGSAMCVDVIGSSSSNKTMAGSFRQLLGLTRDKDGLDGMSSRFATLIKDEPGTDFGFLDLVSNSSSDAQSDDVRKEVAEVEDVQALRDRIYELQDLLLEKDKAVKAAEQKSLRAEIDADNFQRLLVQQASALAASQAAYAALRSQHQIEVKRLQQENLRKSTELDSLRRDVDVERAVNAAALKCLENTLNDKFEVIDFLQNTVNDLMGEKKELNQLLDMVTSNVDIEEEVDDDDGFGHSEWDESEKTKSRESSLPLQPLVQDEIPIFTEEVIADFDRAIMEEDTITSGFCLCNEDGAIVWCNDVFLDISGYEKEEVIGCPWISFLCGPESDEDDVAEISQCIREQASSSACIRGYREDRSLFWMQVRLEPVQIYHKTHELRGSILCVDDVSDMMMKVLSSNSEDNIRDPEILEVAEELSQSQERSIIAGLDAIEYMRLLAEMTPGAEEAEQLDALLDNASKPDDTAGYDQLVLLPAMSDISQVIQSRCLWKLQERGVVAEVLKRTAKVEVSWEGWWTQNEDSRRHWQHWWRQLQEVAEMQEDEAPENVKDAACDGEGVQKKVEPVKPRARAICSVNEPWLILEVNAELEQLIGFKSEEVRGRSISMFQRALDWPPLVECMSKLSREEDKDASLSLDVHALCKDGTSFTNKLLLRSIMDGRKPVLIEAVFDPRIRRV